MAALSEAAQYETLVTSDADARVSKDYLRRCVQELADPGRELASCLYVGRTQGGLAAQLDAVGKSVEMSGGILVADMIEGGTRFALGVSMILRREAFAKAGGYEDLGQYYAEDFVLGQRLASRGCGVRMANYVVRLMVLPQGLRASFRDQLRWMKSTRRSRPAGHLGTGLTYAVPFGVLGLAWGMLAGHPVAGLLWLLATCANRWAMAAVVLWALEDEQAGKPTLIYPLRDLLGFAVWVASYIGDTMQYHGGAYSLGVGGRFEPVAPKAKAGGAKLPGGKLPDAPVRGRTSFPGARSINSIFKFSPTRMPEANIYLCAKSRHGRLLLALEKGASHGRSSVWAGYFGRLCLRGVDGCQGEPAGACATERGSATGAG